VIFFTTQDTKNGANNTKKISFPFFVFFVNLRASW